jgi:hypothetical protein
MSKRRRYIRMMPKDRSLKYSIVQFQLPVEQKEQFYRMVRLDGMRSMSLFLKYIVKEYMSKTESFVKFFEDFKIRHQTFHPRDIYNKEKKELRDNEYMKKFSLDEEELESLFDIFEQEEKDL